jgi:hypothetical protein
MLVSAFGVATICPSENFGCGLSQPAVVWFIESLLVNCERNESSAQNYTLKASISPKAWQRNAFAMRQLH